jgi:hypothetical protein
MALPLAAKDEPKKDLAAPQMVDAAYDGKPVPAPAGAVILFNGKDTANWKGQVRKNDPTNDDSVKWRLDSEGFLEVLKGTGSLTTRDAPITSGHLHIEWATPEEVKGSGQGRGNSGVFISGFPELQVLDSWENETYFDGQAGALYKRSVPLVNASRPPGQWQCYDIYIQRATNDTPATFSAFHNGHLIQDGYTTNDKRKDGTLSFQDHGNPVRYRNIWFIEGAKLWAGE